MAGPYYTTATIVRQTIKPIEADLDDTELGVFITQAESIAESIAGTQAFRTSFDAEKWGIMRTLSTYLAATMALGYDVTEYATTAQATLSADIYWAIIDFCIGLLKDERITTYLGGL